MASAVGAVVVEVGQHVGVAAPEGVAELGKLGMSPVNESALF